MGKTVSLVQRIEVASPCPAKWEEMVGDERSRFCAECKLNVYDFSAMTEEEGEKLIIEKEGKLCGRIYRRADGKVLTKDCPVGWRLVKRKMVMAGIRAAAAVVFVCVAVGSAVGMLTSGARAKLFPNGAVGVRNGQVKWNAPAINGYQHTVEAMRRWLGPAVAVPPRVPPPPGGLIVANPQPLTRVPPEVDIPEGIRARTWLRASVTGISRWDGKVNVWIDAGANSGVKKDWLMSIENERGFSGILKITHVYETSASGEVVVEEKSRPVDKGFKVST
ncbi:MAG TPA: hypothetical protein VG711_01660 [Phycisphaerales bacterium]|nr:hypothetical protein [Phycisphaerales bacterium]